MNSNMESPLSDKEPRFYTIGGVKIAFPHRAYPSQLSMMDKIIRSLTKRQNCLLESPTGSGKSLALLCSALAWQRKFESDAQLLAAELEAQVTKMSEIPIPVQTEVSQNENVKCENLTKHAVDMHGDCQIQGVDLNKFSFVKKNKCSIQKGVCYNDDDDDDFKPIARKRFATSNAVQVDDISCAGKSCCESPMRNDKKNDISFKANCSSAAEEKSYLNMNSVTMPDTSESVNPKEQVLPKKTPKIYFGTRTHKQISQIVRELKKTIYKDSKMTILSSRERTCINTFVLKSDNKQEMCNELVNDRNGPGCPFYRNMRRVNHFNPSRLSEAWDLEDLILKLKGLRACPYFAARHLVQDSEIIFCPYNYLVDPMIRSTLDINLHNNVIIMDEAHNLEDSARDAVSWCVFRNSLQEAINDLAKVAPANKETSSHYYGICNILSAFYGWLSESESLLKQDSFEMASKVYVGEEMVAILMQIGLGPDKFKSFENHVSKVLLQEGDQEVPENHPKLSGSTLFLIKSFRITLYFIYVDNLKYMPDYRCILSKTRNRYISARTKMNSDLQVNFCCLNPAVAFHDIKDSIYTIIVASGTLSPMASFQSELNVPFEITLEANHVISRSQMWVGTIGHGPTGSPLNATFHNTETYAFQDDIGQLILQICSIIPHGILCFVSSYGMLDKLTSRWQTTGLWNNIESRKVIVCEPRGGSQTFENVIQGFYKAVSESKTNESCNGALLIAVCRGKVSEGLDFADENARAVITIGIPFPNIKDLQVELKKKYNDANFTKKKVMSGNEWYETQAFRALNQALGRCIRHRNDFGALIIVDERFQKQPRYVNALSKWIRKEVVHYSTSHEAFNSLQEFSVRTGLSSPSKCTNPSQELFPEKSKNSVLGLSFPTKSTDHTIELSTPTRIRNYSQSLSSPTEGTNRNEDLSSPTRIRNCSRSLLSPMEDTNHNEVLPSPTGNTVRNVFSIEMIDLS